MSGRISRNKGKNGERVHLCFHGKNCVPEQDMQNALLCRGHDVHGCTNYVSRSCYVSSHRCGAGTCRCECAACLKDNSRKKAKRNTTVATSPNKKPKGSTPMERLPPRVTVPVEPAQISKELEIPGDAMDVQPDHVLKSTPVGESDADSDSDLENLFSLAGKKLVDPKQAQLEVLYHSDIKIIKRTGGAGSDPDIADIEACFPLNSQRFRYLNTMRGYIPDCRKEVPRTLDNAVVGTVYRDPCSLNRTVVIFWEHTDSTVFHVECLLGEDFDLLTAERYSEYDNFFLITHLTDVVLLSLYST